ncbi:MAG: sugar transferase [Oscillospiraceae bacterium]
MKLPVWEELPEQMRTESVRPYYDSLQRKRVSLLFKRVFDIVAAVSLLLFLSPAFLLFAIWIKADSPGPILFRQLRITQFGKEFRIFKFRTMVSNAEALGGQVTTHGDERVTKAGQFLRKYRIDEIPQLLNIIAGDMSFVGVRPEVPRYAAQYTAEMYATLLLPAGVTSQASIYYKDESVLLDGVDDIDRVYIEKVLPGKMYYNLKSIENFGFWHEILLMLQTLKDSFSAANILEIFIAKNSSNCKILLIKNQQ